MTDTQAASGNPSRRNFLKVGAGVVAGAVVAGVGVGAYESSVIGTNNSNSSSTVGALQDQLSTTQSQLTETVDSLSNANATISSLTSQLSSTQAALGSAQSSLSAANSQNSSLSQQLTATQGSLESATAQNSSLNQQLAATQSSLTSANAQVSTLQSQFSSAQSQVATLSQLTAFRFLNENEQTEVEALAAAIIPTDSTGPGATEAGVVFFIDGQLAGGYGNNSNMYMEGPWVQPSQAGPITVDGVTYSGGSAAAALTAGGGFQYPVKLQEFWRNCLQWMEDYCNTAYGANFEKLSAAQQTSALQDLWNNKPTNFGVEPQAFFSELHDMVWAGFFTDPLYGGNQNMVGWSYIGFSGTNQGNAYGEGYTTQQLMLSSAPIPLKPQSLSQFQQQSGELSTRGA